MYQTIYRLLTIVIQYIEIQAYTIRLLPNDLLVHPAINVLIFSNIEKKNDMVEKLLKWVVKRI